MGWIENHKNDTDWPDDFIPQANKWGYLNNPRWRPEQEPQADHNYDGREDEEPQVWTPDDQRDTVAGDVHHECGHWHMPEPSEIRYKCPYMDSRMEIQIDVARNNVYIFVQEKFWITRHPLDRFYVDHDCDAYGMYVPANGYFDYTSHLDVVNVWNECAALTLDLDNRFGYFIITREYSSDRTLIKFNIDTMEFVARRVESWPSADREFIFNSSHIFKDSSGAYWWILGTRSENLVRKINTDTLETVDSFTSISQHCKVYHDSMMHPSYNTQRYAWVGGQYLEAIDLEDMSGIAASVSQSECADLVRHNGQIHFNRASVSNNARLLEEDCTFVCATGVLGWGNHNTFFSYKGMIWGWGAGIGGVGFFNNFAIACCSAPENCLITIQQQVSTANPCNADTGHNQAGKAYNYDTPSGLYGCAGGSKGWICRVTFTNPMDIQFYLPCKPEAEW